MNARELAEEVFDDLAEIEAAETEIAAASERVNKAAFWSEEEGMAEYDLEQARNRHEEARHRILMNLAEAAN